jgi:hypothetical protein
MANREPVTSGTADRTYCVARAWTVASTRLAPVSETPVTVAVFEPFAIVTMPLRLNTGAPPFAADAGDARSIVVANAPASTPTAAVRNPPARTRVCSFVDGTYFRPLFTSCSIHGTLHPTDAPKAPA